MAGISRIASTGRPTIHPLLSRLAGLAARLRPQRFRSSRCRRPSHRCRPPWHLGIDPQPNRKVLDWPVDVAGIGRLPRDAGGFPYRFLVRGPVRSSLRLRAAGKSRRVGLISCLGPVDDPRSQTWNATADPLRTRSRAALATAQPGRWPGSPRVEPQREDNRSLSKSMPPSDAEVLRRQDVADALGETSSSPSDRASALRPGTG